MSIAAIIIVAVIITLIVAVPITCIAAISYRKKIVEKKLGDAEEKSREIIDEAIKTAETKKREALLEAKEESLKTKNELERESKERRAEIVTSNIFFVPHFFSDRICSLSRKPLIILEILHTMLPWKS